MKHKDEICVCISPDDPTYCICEAKFIPYLPSSRVKDLVKAAKRMNNYVKEYSGSEMSVQFELLSKNIETALKQFEEEK